MTLSTQNLSLLVAVERERRRRRRSSGSHPRPIEWATRYAQIVHPSRGRVRFDPYPYQRAFLDLYDAPRRIIVKARQVGFSQVFALEALYAAIHEPESTVLLVSRSQDMAVNLLRYCYQTYNNLRQAPELNKQNESEIGFTNGSRIKSIPANRSTGRGFTAKRVYLDEFAYAEYAEDIYQSVSPTIAQGGSMTIGSTPNGMGNLFHGLYLTGEGFERMAVPWRECPAYDQAWFDRERPKYTAQQWAAEFECDFVGSGVVVFSQDAIESASQAVTPRARPLYVISVDVGRRQDATVINVFDISEAPYLRVYHDRMERLPYPLIQQRIEETARAYPGSLWVESNGVGDPVIENLNVYAQPFVTTARSKVQAIQALQLLLEHGDLKADWTPQERRELSAYQWDDRALTQDCVMSLAIGAAAIAQTGTPGI